MSDSQPPQTSHAESEQTTSKRFQRMCWCGLQTIHQFLNRVDRPRKTGHMIKKVPPCFFANIAVTFAVHLVQEEMVKMVFSHESHHTNQSQNYMANHVIWLLRNRGSRGRDGGERLTAAVTVKETDRDSEFCELRDL